MNITHNLVRPRMVPLLAVGAAAMSVGGLFAAGASAAPSRTVNAQQELSQNWSGYVADSTSGKSFSSVSGSWVQPKVTAGNSQTGYSAVWVGLGGSSQQSQELEQAGTAADVSNGQTTYYAWYELVPAAEQRLNLAIHPGDHISTTVKVNGSTVTVSMTDQTTGQSVTKNLHMSNPDTSSAEWIVEAPAAESAGGSYSILPLADFGTVTFTGASATAGGHTGSISDSSWTAQQVDMVSAGPGSYPGVGGFTAVGVGGAGQSTAGASAGSLSSTGSSFTVSYSSDASGGTSSDATSGSGGLGTGSGYPGGSSGYPGTGSGYPGTGYGYPGTGYGYPGGGYGYSGGYGYPGYGYGGGYPGGYSYGGYGYAGI